MIEFVVVVFEVVVVDDGLCFVGDIFVCVVYEGCDCGGDFGDCVYVVGNFFDVYVGVG